MAVSPGGLRQDVPSGVVRIGRRHAATGHGFQLDPNNINCSFLSFDCLDNVHCIILSFIPFINNSHILNDGTQTENDTILYLLEFPPPPKSGGGNS